MPALTVNFSAGESASLLNSRTTLPEPSTISSFAAAAAAPAAAQRAERRARLEQVQRLLRELRLHLVQRREIVEHPERAALRRHDEVIVFDGEISDRHERQVQLEALPVRAIIEADVH